MRVLVVTVGGVHQPIVAAIKAFAPDEVVFLCSDDAGTVKGSYVQVDGSGLVNRSPAAAKPDLPGIATLAQVPTNRYTIIRIGEFDSLEACYVAAAEKLAEIRRRSPAARVVADYTGGTKSMTAGLVLAAVDDPACEISLVAGTRADRDRVRDGTEFARPVAIGATRGRRRLVAAQARLANYDYHGAVAVLETAAREYPPNEVFERVRAAIAICRGLDAWDRFAYREAGRLTAPFRKHLVTECLALDDLCRENPRDPYCAVEDLLLNAERRAAQGRYDDAIARVYRALEMIAQVRLSQLGVATADAVLPEGTPAALAAELERNRSDGKLQLPLFAAWRLLEALDPDGLGRWFSENRGRVRGFLGTRNHSYLAHGRQPITAGEFAGVGRSTIDACRQALAMAPAGRPREARQLPDRLAMLDLESPEAGGAAVGASADRRGG